MMKIKINNKKLFNLIKFAFILQNYFIILK